MKKTKSNHRQGGVSLCAKSKIKNGNTSFELEVKEYKLRIEDFLKSYLEGERKKLASISSVSLQIMDFVIEFCMRGGKRLRAILLIKGYEAVGGKKETDIIHTSICMELMEAFLLIHDDIIDNDPIRRGGPSFHKLVGNWRKSDTFGVSAGIMAGDMLSNLGANVVLSSKFREEYKIGALKEYNDSLLSCFQGELYDVILENENKVSEEQLLKMIGLKTSSYTTVAPLVMGAMLGGANIKKIKIFREFGILLGAAFQITDDILGSFGEEKKLGKPVNSDIRQGKKTLLSIYAGDNASSSELKILKRNLGNKNLTEKDFDDVREIFIKTGALDYAKNKARGHISKAKNLLISAKFKSKPTKFLLELSDFMITRKL
ncbi:MAG: polyprenyl synthetase family protein [bacterium]|nr:polyprenyl synthetase family protein [bacterium]